METPETPERLDTRLGPENFKEYSEFQEYCKDVARQDYKDHYGKDIEEAMKPDTFLSRGFN